MNPERAIEIKGRSYPLVFNTNATFQLGLYLHQNNLGSLGEFIGRLVSGQAELVEIQLFFWACLEGARRRTHQRAQPFTLDEAGELIDAAGGLGEISKQIIAAIEAASPKPSNTSGDGKPKNEKSASGTGTHSSKRRQRSGSSRTSSGT